MKSLLKIIALIIISSYSNAQNADAIIKSVSDKFAKINNYTADVLIKIDVETIKIKDRKAKVSYKRPDQFSFKSDGFILLPKNAGQGDFMKLLSQKSTAIYVKEEIINNVKTHFIKLLPVDPNSEVVLAEVWIDKVYSRVVKLKTYTRQSGSYTVYFYYSSLPYNLPERTIIEFELKTLRFPGKLSGDLVELEKEMKKKGSKGRVIMIYSNYKVNQ